MGARTLRFWIWHNGPTKLSLRDRPIRWDWYTPNEEGYKSGSVEIWRDGEYVYREEFTSGRDCDGRLDTHCITRCHSLYLEGRESDGLRFPLWERVESGQRDYSAEAAGY